MATTPSPRGRQPRLLLPPPGLTLHTGCVFTVPGPRSRDGGVSTLLLGEVLACGAPMRVHWAPSLHSETLCVASAWPGLAGLQGLPASGLSGVGWPPGALFSSELSCQGSISVFRTAPLVSGGLRAHVESRPCPAFRLQHKPSASPWSHHVADCHLVFKCFYICGSS